MLAKSLFAGVPGKSGGMLSTLFLPVKAFRPRRLVPRFEKTHRCPSWTSFTLRPSKCCQCGADLQGKRRLASLASSREGKRVGRASLHPSLSQRRKEASLVLVSPGAMPGEKVAKHVAAVSVFGYSFRRDSRTTLSRTSFTARQGNFKIACKRFRWEEKANDRK